ncbi:unnamed protein product, partial [Laminaria digitata]
SAGAPPPGQAGGLAGGLGRGFGELGQATHDGRGAPEVDQTFYGNGSAGNPFTTLGKQVNKIMTSRAVTSWGNPTTRLWQVICGGRPASMQKAAVQGYVGAAVDISDGVHVMLEAMDGINFLAFTP